ncbi:MAG: lysogenization regulator HflD, partial [Proteobacteria bacterium]|nr:lysogenization regulator HflD [Pseudomonadota bacterium]
MLFTPTQDNVIALAGLAQSGKLVTQLAAEPGHDEAALRASAGSLLVMHPESMDEVFGGVQGVSLGLETMATLLKGKGLQSVLAKELIRYLMSMDQLADRLKQSPSTQAVIEKGLYELSASFSSLLEGGQAET